VSEEFGFNVLDYPKADVTGIDRFSQLTPIVHRSG
jgi:hypothetical protein